MTEDKKLFTYFRRAQLYWQWLRLCSLRFHDLWNCFCEEGDQWNICFLHEMWPGRKYVFQDAAASKTLLPIPHALVGIQDTTALPRICLGLVGGEVGYCGKGTRNKVVSLKTHQTLNNLQKNSWTKFVDSSGSYRASGVIHPEWECDGLAAAVPCLRFFYPGKAKVESYSTFVGWIFVICWNQVLWKPLADWPHSDTKEGFSL